ncbi:hypothetical protein CRYUN_Cryun28dG0057900 [Craigia yunnanensis]
MPLGEFAQTASSYFNSKVEWHIRIIDHCIKKRLQWNTCFARKVCKESEYYEEMMHYLRRNLALFPYHLADHVCRVMRVSPFRYYCDMIFEVMKNEQPYDSIPNFSAADAFRLMGIGRNEFIDIMNKCRSKKIMWKLNKSIAKELLPTQPVDFPIEPWWGICLVNFTLKEFKKLLEEEMATIDKICKEEANAFILFDPDIVKGLYLRGLVYFDVPVYLDDRFKVSRLERFISNKEQSYEDPIEELLYAVFVVSIKVIDPASVLQENTSVPPHGVSLTDEEDTSHLSSTSANMSTDGEAAQQGDFRGTENYGPCSSDARVAFVVDANITSYLMMGSVSPGLKSHAVTLYEVGKLGHDSIADLCKDLSTLEGTKFEGELQEFANHAFSFRCVLECLLSGEVATDTRAVEIADRMGILASGNDEYTLVADTSLTDVSEQSATNETEENINDTNNLETLQEDSVVDDSVPEIAGDDRSATLSKDGKLSSKVSKSDLNVQNDEKLIQIEGPDIGKGTSRRIKKYRVNILRCESLAALPKATRCESLAALPKATFDRLFLRDYDIIVSMVSRP